MHDSCGGWDCPGQTVRAGLEPLPTWAAHRRGQVDFCDILSIAAGDEGDPLRPFVVRGGVETVTGKVYKDKASLLNLAQNVAMTAKWGYSDQIVANNGEGSTVGSMENFILRIMREQDRSASEQLEKRYVFQRFPGRNFELPPALRWLNWGESFFTLGAEMSGVSWHRHNAAVQMPTRGRKRWLLMPPSRPPAGGALGDWSIFEWLRIVYPTLKDADMPLECVVGPGDAIYVPEGWYHAVANIGGDSLAVSLQSKEGGVSETKQLLSSLFETKQVPTVEQRIAVLGKILDLDPTDVDSRFMLAKLQLKAGKSDAGLGELRTIARDDPYHIGARYSIFLHLREKQEEAVLGVALRSFEPLLNSSWRRSLWASHMLSDLYRIKGETDREVEVLEVAQTLALEKANLPSGDHASAGSLNFEEMLQDARRRADNKAAEAHADSKWKGMFRLEL